MTKQSRSKSKGKKKKPKAYKDQAVLPKRASLNTRFANKTNKKLSNDTHSSYRAGFRRMWEVAKKTMKKCGVREPGSYDPKNCHKGEMWGWPFEMNLTNPKVKRIMFDVIDSNKLTLGQLKHVRRSMSYAWKLNPNKTQDQEDEKNWPCMSRVWKTIDYDELPKTVKKKKIVIMPKPDQLERAFKKQWTPNHELNLGEFVQGTVAAYDTFIWGCRSIEDHDRIKKSRKHVIKRAEGYIKTEYKGGRCKSPGFPRAWSKYTICMCPQRKHKSPKSHFKDTVDKKTGKPSHGVPWCTTCPVACLEYVWSHKKAKGKTYANAGKKNGKFNSQQADDIPTRAINWLHTQGIKGEFTHGSGRKALGLLCKEYNIAYRDSFQVHQDLPKTWKDHYQPGMPKHDPTFKDRDQSKDPDTCMVAVRSIVMNWGVGRKMQVKMDRKETLNYYMFRKMGFAKMADDIMSGKIRHTGADEDLPPKVELPDSMKSEDSDSEEEQKMQPTPKRKRKRSIVKEEPSDSDFVERPEPPKKRRKRSKPKAPKPKAKTKKRKRKPEPKPKPKPKPTPKKRKRT
jgi:hypothetical protein